MWFKKKIPSKDKQLKTLSKYLAKERKKHADKDIYHKMKCAGYSEELIDLAFRINDLKGGKMAKQEKYEEDDFDDDEEADEEEEIEEDEDMDDEEQEERPKKPSKPIKEAPKQVRPNKPVAQKEEQQTTQKIPIGHINVIPTGYTYEVVSGFDPNTGEPLVISTNDYATAKILSLQLQAQNAK